MIALLQRVTEAAVHVNEIRIASIQHGVLALIAVERGDTRVQADRLLERVLAYRMFPDTEGRMNLDVRQCHGGLLVVPQFTLAANTEKGNRPSFTSAAAPAEGKALFEYFSNQAGQQMDNLGVGEFGADMRVSLVNDGPVTFWLQVRPLPDVA